jgi:Zn-dependent protease with chaperone function
VQAGVEGGVRRLLGILALPALVALAACAPALPPPVTPAPGRPVVAPARLPPQQLAANFTTAVTRVEPVAEALCRARRQGIPCDLRIVIDDRPGQPPNAFQTVDNAGRPVIGFTLALVAATRNVDEVAFILGHEAAHHILGHIQTTQQNAVTAAVLAGIVAQSQGASAEAIRAATDLGALIGARTYSKDFELQADALGAEIALRSGFDPLRGAEFFNRLPDPGNRFLGSHPPNAARIAKVRETVARLR